jgi:hypothetical protein
MPRSSRQQQLDHAAETTREKIAAEKRKLVSIASAQREAQRKARDKRRYQVGALAEACGLLAVDDAVLRPLFTLVATLTTAPDPVAVLEGLLCDVVGTPGRSLAMATPTCGGVSPLG